VIFTWRNLLDAVLVVILMALVLAIVTLWGGILGHYLGSGLVEPSTERVNNHIVFRGGR